MAVDHEFGSQATELKLSVVEAYLRAFTTALRGKFPELWYIDAFAGTGERTERIPARQDGLLGEGVPESIIRRRGSAKIAIDVEPKFDRLIFVEQRPRAVQALREMRDQHVGRNIHVIEGDANLEIRKIIRGVNWRRVRAVMFLDPYGMSVDWQTLQTVAGTQAIDVWYLFSLSGRDRQAAPATAAIDDDKRAAITRVLGTNAWEYELYAPAQQSLFTDKAPSQRTADVGALQNYVQARLATIFPAVLPPLPLPIDKKPQMFSLFFAISNPDGSAIRLAKRIANHILKAGISSQSRPR
jgi:three-Cys-motif partner protein